MAIERPQNTTILNILPVKISDFLQLNDAESIAVNNIGEVRSPTRLIVRVSHYSWKKLNLQKGAKAYVLIKGDAILAR